MKYFRKNIPDSLNQEIWDWLLETFDKSKWSISYPIDFRHFRVTFQNEKDYAWFMLRWEDVILSYITKSQFTFSSPAKFQIGELIVVSDSRNGTIKRISKILGPSSYELEDA